MQKLWRFLSNMNGKSNKSINIANIFCLILTTVSFILLVSVPCMNISKVLNAYLVSLLFGICGLSGSMFGLTLPESDWYKTNKIRKDSVMIDYSSKEVKLVQTCGACPEQYDMYLDGRNVGYFRLRHGYFRAEYVPTNETVFSGEPKGDGIFECDERDFWLKSAIKAIIDKDNGIKEMFDGIDYKIVDDE